MAGQETGGAGKQTVLEMPRADRLTLIIGLPAGGLLLGLVLPSLARWVLGHWHHGLPFGFLVRMLAEIDQAWKLLIAAAVGAVAGAGIAAAAVTESMTLTVTDAELRLTRQGETATIQRAEVDAVFLDGRVLVVLDRSSCQLASERVELQAETVARALAEHGYPWVDVDPHATLYRRWAAGAPELPGEVDAVLRAREVALRKKARQQARELRTAAEKLGFTVRDEGTRQYWRPLVRS